MKLLARYWLRTLNAKRLLNQCDQCPDELAASFFGRVDDMVQQMDLNKFYVTSVIRTKLQHRYKNTLTIWQFTRGKECTSNKQIRALLIKCNRG